MICVKSYDFEYDGLCLSDMGYIICRFDAESSQTVSNGSQITFNTTSTLNGSKYEQTSSEYGECLETTIQICKNPCLRDDMEIPFKELRDLMSWLNRKEFHKLKFLDGDYLDLYFEASFNVSRIELNGKVYGLELAVTTNRPFALREPKQIIVKNLVQNGTKSILDTSDEEGFIYPETEVTINESGTLSIYNAIEDRTMVIKNCVVGEVIKLDYPIISSSVSSHHLENDFNWVFLRIANSFKYKKNDLTISLPCTIKLKYSPIVKMSF